MTNKKLFIKIPTEQVEELLNWLRIYLDDVDDWPYVFEYFPNAVKALEKLGYEIPVHEKFDLEEEPIEDEEWYNEKEWD